MPSLFFFSRNTHETGKGIITAGLILGVLAVMLVVLAPEPLRQLDWLSYDLMLRGLGKKPPQENVLIVDVDEASLAQYGQWPWPRHVVARLLNAIRNGEPDAVGIDILFAEPDRTSLNFVRRDVKAEFDKELDLSNLPMEMVDHDWELSSVLERGSFYLGMMFRFGERDTAKLELPHSRLNVMHISRQGEGSQRFLLADGAVAAIKQLSQAAEGVGFVNALPDGDGVIRRVPLFIGYNNELYPSIALATFMRSQKRDTVVVASNQQGLLNVKASEALIPVDKQGFATLRFRGPSRTYPYISAADVLNGKISQEIFNRKIVFVGSSAEGLKDTHATPFDRRFPGVEVHATMVGAMLDHDFITIPTWTTGVQAAGALLAVLLVTTMVVQFSTWATGLTLFGFISAVFIGSAALLAQCQVFLSPVLISMVFVLSFTFLALMRFRIGELRVLQRERQLAAARDCAIVGWASLAETRDTETGNHIFRTQRYIQAMAQKLLHHKNPEYRLQPKDVELLFKSSPLHDVGKVGVPDAILLKRGPLTPAEFEEMKKHTLYGAEALAKAESASGLTDDTSFLKTAREIALTHHERWDGSGYPYGIKGHDIPLSGRLMAIADVYDALISKRVYKKAMSHEEAASIIRSGRGTHFDPEIVKLFEELEDVFLSINKAHAD